MAKKENIQVRPLVDEKQISVSPYLVERFGFSAAVFIQRIHFWTEYNRLHDKNDSHFKEGRWWMHKSKAEWVDELPGLCALSSIKRLSKRLKAEGIVLTRFEPREGIQWYALDYQRLTEKIPDHLQPDWLRLNEPDPVDSEPPKLPFEPICDPSLVQQFMLIRWGRRAPVDGGVMYPTQGRHVPQVGASCTPTQGRHVPQMGASRAPDTLYIDSSVIKAVEESVDQPVAAAVESPHPVNEKLYRENIGELSPLLLSELMTLESDFGSDLVEDAIKEAVVHNVLKMAYIASIVTRLAVDRDEAAGSDYWDNESAPVAIKIANNDSDEKKDPLSAELDPRAAWETFTSQIRGKVHPVIYAKMIGGLKMASWEGGVLTIEASRAAGDWLEMRRELYEGWTIRFVESQNAAFNGTGPKLLESRSGPVHTQEAV
jgi:hypothetical protein